MSAPYADNFGIKFGQIGDLPMEAGSDSVGRGESNLPLHKRRADDLYVQYVHHIFVPFSLLVQCVQICT